MSDEDIYQNAKPGLLIMADEAASDGDWPRAAHYLQQALQNGSLLVPAEVDLWRTLALRMLEMGDFHIRWDMAKLIARTTPALVHAEDIASLLDQGDPEDDSFAWFLVRILGDLGGPESIATLVALLRRSPADDVVSAIVMALSQIGTAAIPAVCHLLDEPKNRPAAVQVLARIHHSDAVNALVGVISDADPEIRALAIATLGDAQHPQASPILVDALDDVAPAVRQAAVAGLGSSLGNHRLGPEHMPVTVAKMGALLWDLNLGVRRAAILALGRIPSDDAADLLYKALQSQSMPPVLQRDLIQALARTETAAGIAHLAAYAADLNPASSDDETLCSDIAVGLGRMETAELIPSSVALLKQLLTGTTNANSAIRRAIATSLGRLGHGGDPRSAVEILIQMLAGADVGTRLHITAALRKLSPLDAPQRLAAIATSSQATDDLKQTARLALQDWEQSANVNRHHPNKVS